MNPTRIDTALLKVVLVSLLLYIFPIYTEANVQTVCSSSASATIGAGSGASIGNWIVVQGTGVFTDATLKSTNVTGTSFGINEYQYIKTSDGSVFEDETVYNYGAYAGPDQTVCVNAASIQLNGCNPALVPGSTGSWTCISANCGSVSFSNASQYNTAVTGLTGGNTYTFRWTIVSGTSCGTTSDDVSITVSALPTANAGADAAICKGKFTSLIASGGISYSWSPTTGLNNGSIANPTASPTATTTYTVSVTNINGCTATDQVLVTVNALPTVSVSPNITICEGDNTVLSASGGTGYVWSNGITTSSTTVSPTTSTTYSVTVTNASGCTATGSVDVSVNPLPSVNFSGLPISLCQNAASVTLTGNFAPSGTFTGLGITNLGNGKATFSPSGVTAGSYSIGYYYQDPATLCSATKSQSITIKPIPAVHAVSGVGSYCQGLPGIPISIASPDAGTNYELLLNGVSTGITKINTGLPFTNITQTGTYTVLATNIANSCSTTMIGSVVVSVNPLPDDAQTITGLNSVCAGTTQTYSVPTIANATTYVWALPTNVTITSGAGTATITAFFGTSAASGNISVYGNNSCGSGATSSLAVAVKPTPLAAGAITGTNKVCQGTNNVTYSVATITNATGYTWTVPSGATIVSGQGTSMISVNYTTSALSGSVTVKGTNTCGAGTASTMAVTVVAIPLLTLNKTPNLVTCNGIPVTLTASSGTPNVTYSWTASNGGHIVSTASPTQPTVDAAGDYTVVVTEPSNSCATSDMVTVLSDIQPPVVTVSSTNSGNLTCTVNQLTLTASATPSSPIGYAWTASGGGNITSGGGTSTPVVNAGGVYTVKVTNLTNSCYTTKSITITDQKITPDLTVVNPSADNLTCTKTSVVLSAVSGTSGVGYSWSGPGIVSDGTTGTPTVNQAGIYTVTALSTNGCTNIKIVQVISDLTAPNATVTVPANQLDCNHSQINLNGYSTTAGATWNWTGGVVSGATIQTPTVNLPGTYTINVKHPITGCMATASVLVTKDITPPTVNVIKTPANLTCLQTSVTLGVVSTTGTSYLWTGPGILTGNTTLTPTVNSAGNYLLTVTGANGCTASDAVSVVLNNYAPVVPTINTTFITCTSPTAQLTVSPVAGNASYLWTPVSGGPVTNANSAVATVSATGSYMVTITDLTSGCATQVTGTVSGDNTVPTALITGGPFTIDCVTQTIILDGSTSNGGNPMWTAANGGHFASATNIFKPTIDAGGTYTLTVTNASSGCTQSVSIPVSIGAGLPVISISPNSIPSKITCANPMVTLYGECTEALTSYIWTPNPGSIFSGATTKNPVVNQAGTYLLTATRSTDHCVNKATVTVLADIATPQLVVGTPGQFNCIQNEVQLDASSTSPNVTYNWTTNANGSIKTGDETAKKPIVYKPEDYTVTITNLDNSCTNSYTTTVSLDKNPPNIFINKSPGQLTCATKTLSLSGLSLTTGATYKWTTNGTGNIISGNTGTTPNIDGPGYYKLTVTNPNNGCTVADSVLVVSDKVTPNVWVNTNPSPVITCSTPKPQVDGNSITPNVTYSWSGPGTISDPTIKAPTVDAAGVYTLTVKSSVNGCIASLPVTVTTNTVLPAAPVSSNVSTCSGSTVPTLTATGTNVKWYSSVPSVASKLHDGNTFDPSSYTIAGSTYQFFITQTDAVNGCESPYKQIAYTVNTLPVAPGKTDAAICAGAANPALTATGTNIKWYDTPGGNLLLTGSSFIPPASVSAPATYTYFATQTDANNCESPTKSVLLTINAVPAKPTVNTNSAQACFGSGNPLLTATGNLPKWYSNVALTPASLVNSGANFTPSVTAVATYNYYVTQTSAAGCISPAEAVNLTINALPQAFAVTGGGSYCANTAGKAVGLGGSQALTTYKLYLNNSTLVSQVTGTGSAFDFGLQTGAGSYTVVAQNTNGCTASMTGNMPVVIDPLPLGMGAITGQATVCQGTSSMAYQITPVANATSYVWTVPAGVTIVSGQNTKNIIVDYGASAVSGVISVAGQNTCGLGTSASLNINVVASPNLTINAAGGTLTCKNPTINLTCSSTTGGIGYLWKETNGGAFAMGANTTQKNIDVISAGDYVITIIEPVNSCKTSGTIQVLEDKQAPQGVAISSGNTGVIDCSHPQITLTGSTTSSFAVDYSWTASSGGHLVSGDNTPTPLVDKAGTYTVTVTNTANGCTATKSINIIEDKTAPTIALNLTPAQLNCLNATVQLTGSAANSTWVWTGPAGATYTGGNTSATPFVDKAGTYTITATGTNGCVATGNVTVTQNILPPDAVQIATPGTLTCTNTWLQLTGSTSTALATYAWNASNGGVITSGNTNPLVTINAPGDYTLTVKHPSSYCTQSVTVTVAQNLTAPVVSFPSPPTTITCTSTTSSLTSSVTPNNATIIWSGPGSISNAGVANPTVGSVGTYSLKATDPANGCTTTRTVVVPDGRVFPSVTIAAPLQLTCTQPTVTIHATTLIANYSALWTGPATGIPGINSNLDVVVTKAGTYTLALTDQFDGCTTTKSVVVTADQLAPDISVNKTPSPLTCKILTDTIYGSSSTPNATYLWTGPAAATILNPTTPNPVVNLIGTYTLTVTGPNGCTSTDNVVVSSNTTQPGVPVITTPANITCAVKKVNLAVSPLLANVDYLWSTTGAGIIDNGATPIATVDAIGTYKVIVTERTSGCTNSNTVVVSENKTVPAPVISGGPYILTCAQNTLVLDGSTSTGINPVWASSLGGHIVSGGGLLKPTIDAAGAYTLTTTDATTGCTQSATVNVTADGTLPGITFDKFPAKITCGVPTVTLHGEPANSGDSYTWNAAPGNIVSGGTSFTPVVDQAGNYTITVKSALNSCTSTATIVVESDKVAPILSLATPGQFTCTKTTVTLGATSSSTNASYLWTTSGTGSIKSGDETSQSPVILTPGTYDVLLTNLDNSCKTTGSVVVTQNITNPNVTVDKTPDKINCTFATVTLHGNSTTPSAVYSWTTTGAGNILNKTSPNTAVDNIGWYKLTVTDPANGCTSEDNVEVTNDVTPPDIWVNTNPPALNATNLTVTIQGGSSTPNVSYSWIGPGVITDPIAKETAVNAAGTYYLTVKSLTNGCTSSLPVTVTKNSAVPAAPAGTGATICYGSAPAILHATGTNVKWYSDATLGTKLHDGNDFTPSSYTTVGDHFFFITQTDAVSMFESPSAQVTYSIKALPLAAANVDKQICFGSANIALEAIGTSVRWYDIPGGTLLGSGNQYTPAASVSAVGTYTYYATQTDANNCESPTVAVKLLIKSIPSAPSVDKVSAAICQGSTNPSFTASGGSIEWYYLASLVATTNLYTPTISAVGTYHYNAKQNVSGCVSPSTDVSFTINPLPSSFNVTGGGSYCSDKTGVVVGLDGSETSATYQLYLNGTTATGTPVSGTGAAFGFGNQKTAGTYTVNATNSNGCQMPQTSSVAITVSQTTAAAGVISGINKVCQGTTGVTYSVSPIAYASNYVWTVPANASITSGQGTNSIVVNYGTTAVSGTISVYGENTCGTGATSTLPVTAVPTPQLSVNMMPGTITCAIPQLKLSASSTTTGTSFLWNASNGGVIVSAANIQDPDVSAAGDYLVTVTETSNSCTAQAKVTVTANTTVPQGTTLTAALTELTCLVTQIDITAATISTFPVSYTWTPNSGGHIASGQNTPTIRVNKSGDYEVVIKNLDNGCSITKSIPITEQKVLPNLSVTDPATDAISCTKTKIPLWSYSSTSGATYSWSGPGIIDNPTAPTPDVYTTGTYTVTVTAPNGCTSSNSVQVSSAYLVPTKPVILNPDPIDCNHPTIFLNGSSSTTGALLYWTGPGVMTGQTTQTPEVNLPGLYTLTATHPISGCTSMSQVTVVKNTAAPAITFPVIPQTITCTVPNITIKSTNTATTPVYQWTTVNGTIVSGGNNSDVIVSKAGTYTLGVTDTNNGCSATSSITVAADQNAPGASIAAPASLSCNIPSFDLAGSSATTPVNIEWTTADGIITTGSTSFTPTVKQGGTYVMKITNPANGCISTASILVPEDKNKPVISIDKNPPVLNCQAVQVTLTGTSSGASLQWTGPVGAVITSPTSSSTKVNLKGRYYLTATTANGCKMKDSTEVLDYYAKPSGISIDAPVTLTCLQTTQTLTGHSTTALATFKWSAITGGNIVSSASSSMITINGPGEYKMVVTDPISYCKDSTKVTVAQDVTAPAITIPSLPADITCTNTTSLLSSAVLPNNSSLKWTGPGVISNDAIDNPVVSAPGIYTLTATHPVTGCTITRTVTVLDKRSTPDVAIASPGVLSCTVLSTVLTGSTSVTAYAAKWTTTNGAITAPDNLLNATVTKSGLYTLTITNNANGCTNSANILVNADNTVPDITVDKSPDALTCTRTTVKLFGATSTADTKLSWSGPGTITDETTPTPTVNAAGTFILTVTSKINGCFVQETVVVGQNTTPPDVPIILTPATLTCTQTYATLEISPLPTNVNYVWTTTGTGIIQNETTPIATVNAIGTYTVKLTDRTNGCTRLKSVVVSENKAVPTVSITGTYVLTCGTPAVTLNGSSPAGINPVWTCTPGGHIASGGNTFNPTVNGAGTYTLTVTHATTGCTALATVPVTATLDVPTFDVDIPADLTCTTQTVTIHGKPNQTGSTYTWSASPGHFVSGQTSYDPIVDQPGTYILEVTNTSGCVATGSIVVKQRITPPVLSIASADKFTCTNHTVQLKAASTNASVSYHWSTSGSGKIKLGDEDISNPNVETPATYTVALKDLTNGCVTTGNVVVTEDITAPNISVDKYPAPITCARKTSTLTGNSLTTGATYKWTTTFGGNIGNYISKTPVVDAIGYYVLTVTDPANGCIKADSTEVEQDMVIPNVWVNVLPDTLNCAAAVVNVNGNSSTTGTSFLWSGPGVFSDATSKQTTVDAPGTYFFRVTKDANGCTASLPVVVFRNVTVLSAPLVANADVCLGAPAGTLHASGNSGATLKWYSDASLLNSVKVQEGSSFTPTAIATVGTTYFFVTQTDHSSQCRSLATQVNYTVHALPAAPVNMDKSICFGLSNPALQATGSNIRWYNAPTGSLLTTGNAYTPPSSVASAGGYIFYATQTDTYGCQSAAQPVVLTIYPRPSLPLVDKLTVETCYGTSNPSFTASGVNMQWYASPSLPAAIKTGGVFASAETAAGTYNYYVTQTSSEGCQSLAQPVTFVVKALPQSFNLTGGGVYCADLNGVAVGLSGSEATASYQLLLNGTTVITSQTGTGAAFNFGLQKTVGNYSILATGANGCTNTMTGGVSVGTSPLPSTAGTVTGLTPVCQNGVGVTYSVAAIANATSYVWDVPAGVSVVSGLNSNTIQVDMSPAAISGAFRVYGKNACGIGGTSADYQVIIRPLPAAATAINYSAGNNSICPGTSTYIYEVDPIAYATSYEWNLPTGCTILSGNNTSQIRVQFATNMPVATYNLKVRGKNSCGTGAWSALYSVMVNTIPPVNAGIDQNICTSTVLLQGSTIPSGGTANWSIYTGTGTIVTGSSSSTSITNLAQGENVMVYTIEANGCHASDSVKVINNTLYVDAGNSLPICSTSVTLQGTPPPSGTTGQWSVVSGSATFAASSLYNCKASNFGYGDNKLYWSVTKMGCVSKDSVVFTNYRPTTPDAGPDQILCNDHTSLAGNTPIYGTGNWSVYSGSVTLGDASVKNTAITNVGKGKNVLVWTITNIICSLSDTVYITNSSSVAAAGYPQTVCDNRTTMAAQAPSTGETGQWSVLSGSAAFLDGTVFNTKVSGLLTGPNTLMWSITKGNCVNTDTMIIICNQPSNPNAGIDLFLAGSTATMAANRPDIGEGKWSVVNGAAIFASDTSHYTTVTGLNPGSNILRWTITYNKCSLSDDVTLTNGTIENVDAGQDQTICTNDTKLEASRPQYGFGMWTVLRGSANFANNETYNTTVTNLAPGNNLLRWTVTISGVEFFDTVHIVNNKPTLASTGPPQIMCSDSTGLTGSVPIQGTGKWTIEGGSGTIDDVTKYNSKVTHLGNGDNLFRWTITKDKCINSATMVISNNTTTQADAGSDQTICEDSTFMTPNTPFFGTGEWSVLSGTGLFEGNKVRGLAPGKNVFRYTIRKNNCSTHDEVQVTSYRPTTPNAGANLVVCVDTSYLTANPENAGIGETGRWTVQNGSGVVADTTAYSTVVRKLGSGKNILRWTITNHDCKAFSEVEVNYAFIKAKAGDNVTSCNDNLIMNANNASFGKGEWSIIGGSGTAVFASPNSPNTNVTNLDKGTNILRWTIRSQSCISSSDVTIVNNAPSDAYAGGDKALCTSTYTLAAKPAAIGTCVWTVLSGSGYFADTTAFNTLVSNIGPGVNTYRWTITHANCVSSDEVVISNNQPINTFAGTDQTYCADTAVLEANQPILGTGIWSIAKGGGFFRDPYDPFTTVRFLANDTNYIRWTVTNKQCVEYKEIKIVNNLPTPAAAGSDRPLCSEQTLMDGNRPKYGTGEWTIISGSAKFSTKSLFNTLAQAIAKGSNTLRWTISKYGCVSYDDVVLTNDLPDTPDAGTNIPLCDNTTLLNGTNPSVGRGFWKVVTGAGTFVDSTRYDTRVNALGEGINLLRWTTVHNRCSLYDNVEVRNNKVTTSAGPDQTVFAPTTLLTGTIPPRGTGIWSLNSGTATIVSPDNYETSITDLVEGQSELTWAITIENCVSSDKVVITYRKVPTAVFEVDQSEGCPPFPVTFTKTKIELFPYKWDFGDNTTDSVNDNPSHIYTKAGSYKAQLIVNSPDGKIVTKEKMITVFDLPKAKFEYAPLEVFIPGQEVRFYNYSDRGATYLWNFGDGSTSTDFNPVYTYKDSGLYNISLKVWTDKSCTDSMTVSNAIHAVEKTRMRFPSAFSPNTAGSQGGKYNSLDFSNDVFFPKVEVGSIIDYKMEIYNRWGVLVFKSNDINIGWDGYYNGKLLSQEVYVYHVTGLYNDGKRFNIAGDVILIRK